MMVAYELGNLGGTRGLRWRARVYKEEPFLQIPSVCKHSRQSARDSRTVLCSTFRVRSLNSQGPTGLFVYTESTMSLRNVAAPTAAAGVAATSG